MSHTSENMAVETKWMGKKGLLSYNNYSLQVPASDARLIAAAPDMLEALEYISEKFKAIEARFRSDEENAVINAITKAKGD